MQRLLRHVRSVPKSDVARCFEVKEEQLGVIATRSGSMGNL
jgi:hypothetical protein